MDSESIAGRFSFLRIGRAWNAEGVIIENHRIAMALPDAWNS